MEAIRLQQTIQKSGELTIRNLPVEQGQQVEVVVLFTPADRSSAPHSTARQLLNSGLIGIWNDRDDIADSPTFARRLREQAQRRPNVGGVLLVKLLWR